MARVGLADVEHYNSGATGSFFQLKKDKEVAKVRIMIDKLEDIEDYMYACHRVEVPGSQWGRNVNCLRAYNEPLEKCPFCEAGMKPQVRVFIPLYNEDAEEVQIFERGKGYLSKFSSFVSRYQKPTMVSHIVEIERNGKENDTKTTYELYDIDKDETTLEDLPEVPEILGGIVMDKSADDMNYYLDSGDDHEFPPDDDTGIRRRNSKNNDDFEDAEGDEPFEDEESENTRGNRRRSNGNDGEERRARTDRGASRRTPANGGNRRRSY